MNEIRTLVIGVIIVIGSCGQENETAFDAKTIQNIVAEIDDQSLREADDNQSNWLSYGKNYQENRFSELSQINKDNVSELKLAWSLDLGTTRGIETTPIVVDGIMYATGPWSMVYAVNAVTGELIWEYEPQVPRGWGEKVCCDVVNRGVAIYKGKVYVGTLDGRLIALDAGTGEKIWSVLTVDQSKPYSITGAPRIIKGKIIIGNGGADLGVRGYVSAYDAESGDEVWRFYTVPGDPNQPFESQELESAVETWTGEWWKYGGGGTVWDAMAYDPELDLLYIGTGNGSPWNRDIRSPGGGDNLFLSSIIALHPDSGKMEWYYQTTPGDSWDYTATQHIILAELEIDGKMRKVLMQAPKNGFFYVLDRTNGELISAEPYVYMNWARRVDMETGRPEETSFARYPDKNVKIAPSPAGGHNWQPMSFNPLTGLVYIPARESAFVHGQPNDWKYEDDSRSWNTASDFNPALETLEDDAIPENQVGKLLAWDPVNHKRVWSAEHASSWNAGVMSTADLVFQGTAEGEFKAYDASSGENLWSYPLETGILGSPVTYEVAGTQYITIAVGWGGVLGLWFKMTEQINTGHIYTFALNGTAEMPDFPKQAVPEIINLEFEASAEEIVEGESLYRRYCSKCHGGGSIPRLDYSTEAVFNSFQQIVYDGIYLQKGMPEFKGRLTGEQVENIKKFILNRAKESRERGE